MTTEFYIAAGVALLFLLIVVIQAVIYRIKFARGNLSKKLVDTSVIIDGRLNEIARTGFLEGLLLVPKFVLHELQLIADSQDNMKRSKGRRGLDILNDFRKIPGITVELVDRDYKHTNKVDEKLVELARELNASILTNDYNLNKIAEIQGIRVLNINDLSNSIKPSFLPGEKISVRIMKEGREREQGIAYMPDGTMIVVDNAKKMLNRQIDVTVTNVLQTDAGRMIFAKYLQGEGGQQNQNKPQGKPNDKRGRFRFFKKRGGGRNRQDNRPRQDNAPAAPDRLEARQEQSTPAPARQEPGNNSEGKNN